MNRAANRAIEALRAVGFAAMVILLAVPLASAEVTQQDLVDAIAGAPPPGARLPLSVVLRNGSEKSRAISRWLDSTPSVWIVADFTCRTLCSPVLRTTADVLTESGLRAGRDFSLIVLGLDPKDTAADGAAMKAAQVGADGPLAAHTAMLRGTDDAIGQVTRSLGFHATYDAEHDQFAHSAAVFVITADGHVSRTFSGLSIAPADIRLALVEAGQGRIGTLADHVRLLCYGFDPARGAYNLIAGRALAIGGGATIAVLALFLGLMFRRERAVRR